MRSTAKPTSAPLSLWHRFRRFLIDEGQWLLARDRKLRRRLWHHPFILALLGGTGVILFWRGIWHVADITPILENPWVSMAVGAGILAITGLFVLQLIGQAYLEERMEDLQALEETLVQEESELEAHEERIEEELQHEMRKNAAHRR